MADDPAVPGAVTPAALSSAVGAPAAAVVSSPVAAETAPAPAAPGAPESAAPAASSPDVPRETIAEPAKPAKPAEPAKPAAVEVPKPPASMLAEAAKEPPKAEAEKSAEPTKPEEIAPLHTFEPFALPEGVKLGEKEVGQFTTMLGELARDTKADPRLLQEFGQKAIDMYVQERARDATLQMENWIKTRQGWQKEVKEDAVLGRNRHETVMRDAARVRDMFATKRFSEMIEYTGAGDHPGMIDFVYNIARFLEKNGLLREGGPVPAPPSRAPAGRQGPRSRYRGNQQTGA